MTDPSPPPPTAATVSASDGAWEETTVDQAGCAIFQRGRHRDGTFIRVYVPKQAEDPNQPLRAILYLHGFALCPPTFYEVHLRELAGQGWIVIYPDFQCSTYREAPLSGEAGARGGARVSHALPRWGRTTRRLLLRRRETRLDLLDLPEELGLRPRGEQARSGKGPSSVLPELKVKDLRRVLLPWLLIQLVLTVIGWFRRTYARNLGELLGTVLLSLAYSPTVWLRNALTLADKAWDDLAALPQYAHWRTNPVTVDGFGHSLGGLLCLCLPTLAAPASGMGGEAPPSSRFQPRGILAADPATSTEMGIPGFAIALLKLFNAPFTAQPLDIETTGKALRIPVTIVHGLDDTIVPPSCGLCRAARGPSRPSPAATKPFISPAPTASATPIWWPSTTRPSRPPKPSTTPSLSRLVGSSTAPMPTTQTGSGPPSRPSSPGSRRLHRSC